MATIALAAGYANQGAVDAGTTVGILIANVPVVFLGGGKFAQRLPMKTLHHGATLLLALLGIWFIAHALARWPAAP